MGAGRLMYEAAQAQQAELLALRARVARLEEAGQELLSALNWDGDPSPFGLEINAKIRKRERVDVARADLRCALEEK